MPKDPVTGEFITTVEQSAQFRAISSAKAELARTDPERTKARGGEGLTAREIAEAKAIGREALEYYGYVPTSKEIIKFEEAKRIEAEEVAPAYAPEPEKIRWGELEPEEAKEELLLQRERYIKYRETLPTREEARVMYPGVVREAEPTKWYDAPSQWAEQLAQRREVSPFVKAFGAMGVGFISAPAGVVQMVARPKEAIAGIKYAITKPLAVAEAIGRRAKLQPGVLVGEALGIVAMRKLVGAVAKVAKLGVAKFRPIRIGKKAITIGRPAEFMRRPITRAVTMAEVKARVPGIFRARRYGIAVKVKAMALKKKALIYQMGKIRAQIYYPKLRKPITGRMVAITEAREIRRFVPTKIGRITITKPVKYAKGVAFAEVGKKVIGTRYAVQKIFEAPIKRITGYKFLGEARMLAPKLKRALLSPEEYTKYLVKRGKLEFAYAKYPFRKLDLLGAYRKPIRGLKPRIEIVPKMPPGQPPTRAYTISEVLKHELVHYKYPGLVMKYGKIRGEAITEALRKTIYRPGFVVKVPKVKAYPKITIKGIQFVITKEPIKPPFRIIRMPTAKPDIPPVVTKLKPLAVRPVPKTMVETMARMAVREELITKIRPTRFIVPPYAPREIIREMPITTPKYMQRQFERQFERQITMVKQRQLLEQRRAVIQIQTQAQLKQQLQKRIVTQIQVPAQAQKQRLRYRLKIPTAQVPITTPVVPIIPTPTPPPPFPPVEEFIPKKIPIKRKIIIKPITAYMPSFKALFFKIRGPRPPKKMLTPEFRFRPIPTRWRSLADVFKRRVIKKRVKRKK